jgi:predicted ATP-binding protein involved in virulence
MRVKYLRIKNFRGISELALNFDKTEPTILIGINGAGKSSVLDCISILLSLCYLSSKDKLLFNETKKIKENSSLSSIVKNEIYNSVLWQLNAKNNDFKYHMALNDEDIKNYENKTENQIVIEIQENESEAQEDLKKEILITANKVNGEYIESPLGDSIDQVMENLRVLENVGSPLWVYYPVSRLIQDISLENYNEDIFEQVSNKSFLDKQIDFASFFEWFRNREDLENEELRDNPKHQDTQLHAVRNAISEVVPSFSNLRVRRSPLRMTVVKQGQELIINQLSDGEKCLIAMVGDLARRLAITSPALDDPLLGNGIVLIDEIEQHLHPGWQYEIIPALTRTFPNCQFIVTTHSPIVLSQVKPEGIFCLEKRDGKVIAYHPDSSYGRDTNRILEDLMGVPERPQVFKDKLRELFRFIDDGNIDKAKELQHQLEESIGSDEPEFARADVLIRRKEILGR